MEISAPIATSLGKSGASKALSNCPRLILLPGLGADGRMFRRMEAELGGVDVPPWLSARPRETLAEYGRRMAATIDGSRPYVLGGASFGGMVALEVARHTNPAAVILIASCRSGRQIPLGLRSLEAASRVLPMEFIQAARQFVAVVAGRLVRLEPDARQRLISEIREAPLDFLRWGARAIMEWPDRRKAACLGNGCPVFQIHGDRDPLIPQKYVRPDHTVRGGGHLLNDTHAAEVCAAIRGFLDRLNFPTHPSAGIQI